MATEEGNWPGKVEPYREAKAEREALEVGGTCSPDAMLVAASIREGLAGIAQILDKVAYAARKGGAA
jgi:hypothetical protein